MSLEHLRSYLERDGICADPVFIIGSPRSGTTALAHALGCHPELWVSKESYFLHQLFGNGRAVHAWEHNWERGTPSWIREERVERAEFLGFLGLAMNALFSSRSQGRRWVDQTPLYTLMADDLAEMFPGALFLHIIRDGRSVVRSMGQFENLFDEGKRATLTDEVPAWATDIRVACATWAEWVEAASAFAAERPDRCLTVVNELLAADPVDGFTRVERFLGVGHDPRPACRFKGPRVNSSFRRAKTRPRDHDWDDWSPELREVFVEEAGSTLVRAGYASSDELGAWLAAGSRR